MDEKNLQAILSRQTPPEPQQNAADDALLHALSAFDEKISENAQGNAAPHRLTDTNDWFATFRSIFMSNKFSLSGLAGGVAVIALVGVLGAPFIEQKMAQYSVKKQVVMSSSGSFSEGGSGGGSSSFSDQGDFGGGLPPAYEQAQASVAKQSSQVMASNAAQKDIASYARPIARASERIEAPAAPAAGDPLSEWRRESEVRRLERAAPSAEMAAKPAPAAIAAQSSSSSDQGSYGISPVAPPPVLRDMQQTEPYRGTGSDQFQRFEESPVKSVSAEPVSTFSIDVDTASYAFIRRQLNNGVIPAQDAVRIEEMINYFDYDYKLPESAGNPFQPNVAVYDAPWHKGHKIVHVGIKGYDLETKPASNLVLLIDTSGSMAEPDKLPLLKSAFKMMLDNLSPSDTVGIVVYAGSAGTVLTPTRVAEKDKIIAALDHLQPGGATAGEEGIRQAYALAQGGFLREGNNRVILATDGDFNVGINDPQELKNFITQKREAGIFLSVLGFGQGNYNDAIMQSLAQNGNGNAAYIDTMNEARKVLVHEANATLFTIAKDVKIQVEFNPGKVAEYRLIGYETRKLNREDFNNDRIDAGEVGAGHAVTALYEITPVGGDLSVDDLRYGVKPDAPVAAASDTGEYAFLKIRYKKPDGDTSILMTRPIDNKDDVAFAQASDDVRFAAAVAQFGQKLRFSTHAGNMTWDELIDIANGAKGRDEFGMRSEFVNLVRAAKTAQGPSVNDGHGPREYHGPITLQ